MLELVLVRHGETVGQSSIRLYGATDVALAPAGEAQVRAAGQALRASMAGSPGFDRVFTSPLVRARRSAELVLEELGDLRPPAQAGVDVVEAFREVDFGRWEGWTWEEVAARDPESLARHEAEGPRFRYPEGESREGFVARVQGAVGSSLEAAFAGGAQRVLGVLHKGVIRAIAGRMLQRPTTELDGGWGLALGGHRILRAPDFGGPWR